MVRGNGVCVIEAMEEAAPVSDSKFWSDADAIAVVACACPSVICVTGCKETLLTATAATEETDIVCN